MIFFPINKFLLSAVFCIFFSDSSANTDTTWLTGKWKLSDRSNAFYYLISSPQDSLWNQTMYFAGNNKLYMSGKSKNKDGKIRAGIYKWYNQYGILTDSVVYDNEVPVSMISFHLNGQRKTVLIHDKNYHALFVNSWDENGNESFIDTFYYSNYGHSCNKDTANMKGIINKEDNIWQLRFYDLDTGTLLMNGHFKERLCKTRIGKNIYYYKNGSKDSLLFDNNGEKKEGYFYHANGKMSAIEKYDETGKSPKNATYWNDAGNKLSEKDMLPKPIDYLSNWQQDFVHRVNNDKSIDAGMRKLISDDTYLMFFINDDGKLIQTSVKPSAFPVMDSLIVQTFRQYSQWTPPRRHGRKSNYTGQLHIVFKEGKLKENKL